MRIMVADFFFLKRKFLCCRIFPPLLETKMAGPSSSTIDQKSLTQQQTVRNQLLPALTPSGMDSFQSIILEVLRRKENKEIPFVPIGFHQFAPTREELLIKRMFESCAFKSGMSCVLGK